MSSLDEQLRRWRAAGLLDDAAVAAIRDHEAGRTRAAGGREDRWRVSLQEVIAYAGVALALAGGALFVGLHHDDLGLAGRLAVDLAVSAAALVASVALGRGDEAGRRAASGCLLVAMLGVGAAVGDASATGGWFSVHHLSPGYGYGPGATSPPLDEVDHTGDAGLGLAAVAALALVATLWTRSALLALVLAAATFAATFCALGSGSAGPNQWALVTCIPGAALVAAAFVARLRERAAGEVLRFSGTAVATVTLVMPDGATAALAALAAAVSVAALVASTALRSNALAVAGGLGLFAVVLDIGLRWFQGPLGLPLVLIATGVALIGVAALIQRIVGANRARAAQPA